MIDATQAFAPVISANWRCHHQRAVGCHLVCAPGAGGSSATKSAAWSFTNALRIELRKKGTQALALHVGYMDTDLTKGLDIKKIDPRQVAARTLDGFKNGSDEVLADEQTNAIKRSRRRRKRTI